MIKYIEQAEYEAAVRDVANECNAIADNQDWALKARVAVYRNQVSRLMDKYEANPEVDYNVLEIEAFAAFDAIDRIESIQHDAERVERYRDVYASEVREVELMVRGLNPEELEAVRDIAKSEANGAAINLTKIAGAAYDRGYGTSITAMQAGVYTLSKTCKPLLSELLEG